MSFQTILVTGSNRGIGLEFVKQLNAQPFTKHIFAACRSPLKAKELQNIAQNSPKVHIIQYDSKNVASFDKIIEEIKSVLGDDGLNLLINNAGVLYHDVKYEQLTDCYHVNSIAPLMLTKACIPILKESVAKNSPTLVVNVSSGLGSIGDDRFNSFFCYPYKMSKAALNMATKILSVEHKDDNIKVISICPGWVKTDMGGPNAMLDVVTSIASMLGTFEKIISDDSSNGKFFSNNGEIYTW